MDKTNETTHEKSSQVTFRMPASLRNFYEERAKKERRRLSDIFRIALEDHALLLQAAGTPKVRTLRVVEEPEDAELVQV